MKWFKHSTGSLNNSFIFELVEEFGGDGYMVFFGTIELMADEFDPLDPGRNTMSIKKLTKNLQLSRQKVTKILQFIDRKSRVFNQKPKITEKKSVGFYADINATHVELNCPRLKALCDDYTRRQLQNMCEQSSDSVSTKKEKEKEIKKEIIKKGTDAPGGAPFKMPTDEQV